MGFNLSAQTPKLLENTGAYSGFVVGMATASGGLVESTLQNLSRIDGVIGTPQESTGVAKVFVITLTSGNNFTGECITVSGDAGTVTGSDVVMFLAWGKPKA